MKKITLIELNNNITNIENIIKDINNNRFNKKNMITRLEKLFDIDFLCEETQINSNCKSYYLYTKKGGNLNFTINRSRNNNRTIIRNIEIILENYIIFILTGDNVTFYHVEYEKAI